MSKSPEVSSRDVVKIGKRGRLRAGIGSTIDRVFAGGVENTPQEKSGYYEPIPLDELDPDPSNPRWENRIPPTWDQILNPNSIPDDDELKEDVEYIHGLAYSMEPPIGQSTPGDVYRREGRYLIISGECRYWALRLRAHWAGQPGTFNAVIRPDPPAHIQLLQYLENYKRRSPGLPQQLSNLLGVLKESQRLGKPIEDAKKFAEVTGAGQVMGYRWWSVLNGPEDVRSAVLAGTITNIKHAYVAAQEADPAKRAQLLANPSDKVEEPKSPISTVARSTRKKKGRPTKYLTLGKTRSPEVAKHLLQRLDPDTDYGDVDWSNFAAVRECWDKLIKRLEKQFKR